MKGAALKKRIQHTNQSLKLASRIPIKSREIFAIKRSKSPWYKLLKIVALQNPLVGNKLMQTIMRPPPYVKKMTTMLKGTSATRMLKKTGWSIQNGANSMIVMQKQKLKWLQDLKHAKVWKLKHKDKLVSRKLKPT
jgi:hypothetical protein